MNEREYRAATTAAKANGGRRAWKTVRTWIRRMVNLEPRVMREVAAATFGDLGSWLEKGKGNVEVCGCLVGTTALKMIDARNSFDVLPATKDSWGWQIAPALVSSKETPTRSVGTRYEPYFVVGDLLKQKELRAKMCQWAESVGVAAADLKNALDTENVVSEEEANEQAVALIKAEIRRQLRFRTARRRRQLAAA